jgi:adenylate cyclase
LWIVWISVIFTSEEGERIYGDGVNIAARVEGLANIGGICISGTAYHQVENKLPFEFEYLGEQAVKNIKKPVSILVLKLLFLVARNFLASL